MQKSLYSLILSDSVVSKIDMLALKKGTNRSNLINMILADYLSLTTPEMRIENIFRQVEKMLSVYDNIVPVLTPNRPTMSVKTTLEYKYRPTLKYDVHLYREIKNGAIGQLSVSLRTQSEALISVTDEFFEFFIRLEGSYLPMMLKHPVKYCYGDVKFVRSIMFDSTKDNDLNDVADSISAYIKCFDDIIKGTVSGKYSFEEADEKYRSYLNSINVII